MIPLYSAHSQSDISLRSLAVCLFLAQADSAHFSVTPDWSKYFLTTDVLAALGSLGTTWGVKERYRYRRDWRGTPVEGPSMIACTPKNKKRDKRKGSSLVTVLNPFSLCLKRTLLWSIISTITANFPANSPWLMRTTRPTSTKRLNDSRLDIVTAVAKEVQAKRQHSANPIYHCPSLFFPSIPFRLFIQYLSSILTTLQQRHYLSLHY